MKRVVRNRRVPFAVQPRIGQSAIAHGIDPPNYRGIFVQPLFQRVQHHRFLADQCFDRPPGHLGVTQACQAYGHRANDVGHFPLSDLNCFKHEHALVGMFVQLMRHGGHDLTRIGDNLRCGPRRWRGGRCAFRERGGRQRESGQHQRDGSGCCDDRPGRSRARG